jgi:tetratricopeptide (TPR) repeat protein
MDQIRNLIHEIHRRSLWQVLGIFLASAWGVLQVVEFVTESAGLPDWTPSMALVLLMVGLPICLATAFVQEGMPGQSHDDQPGADEDGATTASQATSTAQAHQPPKPNAEHDSLDGRSSHPSSTRLLLTWKNAVFGGLGAFALLGISLIVYFVMWSTGIGPVGSLVAQEVIVEGQKVVLASFDDTTGEGLGSVVTEALRVDLTQAEVLDLAESSDIAPTLRRMQLEPGTRLDPDLAREVAVREGLAAVIDGSIGTVGSGYLITATLRNADTGDALATFRETADGPDALIATIDKISQDIRERSGESLKNIKAGQPLSAVTTTSLKALRLYSESEIYFGSDQRDRALELLEQAVQVDPAFAMAWRKLSAAYYNQQSFEASIEAATQAFANRERLSERERYLTEAGYYERTGSSLSAVEAYQAVLDIDPENGTALNNIANVYNAIGERELGLEMYQRALAGPNRTVTAMGNLVLAYLALGQVEAAAEALAEYEAAYPNANDIALNRFHVLLLSGANERARVLAQTRLEDATLGSLARSEAAMWLRKLAFREGRFDEARELA